MIRLIEVLAVGVTDVYGAALASGTVDFYEAGTSTRKTAYQEFALETPHSNPATLDDAGRLIAFVDERTKLVISDSQGTVVRTIDNIGTSDSDVAVSLSSNLAGNGLVDGSDGAIDVNVDGSTITIVGDALAIADDAQLPGDPSTEGSLTIGNDLVVTDHSSIGGDEVVTGSITTTAGDVILGTVANANIAKYANTTKVGIKKGGAGATRPIVTSYDEAKGLIIVRGQVTSGGAISLGEGYTSAKNSTGNYTVTYTDAFSAGPCLSVALEDAALGAFYTVMIRTNTTTAFTIEVANLASVLVDLRFNFIAIGPRNT